MKKTNTQQVPKKSDGPWISGSIVKKALLPSFCFAVLSTVAFEETIFAEKTSSTQISSNSVQTTKYVNVTSGTLNLRKSTSMSSAIVTTLSKGMAVTVYSETKGWAKVSVNGKNGYVSSGFLSSKSPTNIPSSPTTTAKTKYVNVKSGTLNMRNGTSTSASIIVKLAKGKAVMVYSEANGWAKIKVYGKTGYVSSAFLSGTSPSKNSNTSTSASTPVNEIPDKQTTINKYVNINLGSTLNMRKSASLNASILIKLARGVKVIVHSEAKGWAKIEAYGQMGYVQAHYLFEKTPPVGLDAANNNHSEPSKETTKTKYVDVIYGSSLNMRSSAAGSASIVTKLSRGTLVTILSEGNGWAKVAANGKTGYVSTQYLSLTPPFNPNTTSGTIDKVIESYDIPLSDLVQKQMAVKPQTDKSYDTYIRADGLTLTSETSGTVHGSGWNVRGGAGPAYWVVGQVKKQDTLQILGKLKGTDGYDWYQVKFNKTWVNASPEDVTYYADPNNFQKNSVDSLQFLKLSVTANISGKEVNERILSGKGSLQGLASTFIKAGNTYGINELYLISHALLETNKGKSQLAQGVQINGKTVYNMFGIGAYDQTAVTSGAQFAYNAGWFSPEKAILGGAQFIANGYINAGQDTLYKMRWNPGSTVTSGRAAHHYASDIGWAAKQVHQIYNLYNLIDSYKLVLEIPKYK
ncbi:SH3 domain-containing protein [Neobacillus sp. C211]|uniref:SH3 domain-containing protein n=1 Tax=unclassified Neobacillus TaxID=2675272 RepID=UPI003979D460